MNTFRILLENNIHRRWNSDVIGDIITNTFRILLENIMYEYTQEDDIDEYIGGYHIHRRIPLGEVDPLQPSAMQCDLLLFQP